MIKSMTGFGVAGFENEQMMIQIEVRSLNSKFLDLSIRSPRQFSDREPEIRTMVQGILDRGKVSVSVEFLAKGSQNLPVTINRELFKTYFEEFKNLAETVGETPVDLFKLALQAPNVIVSVPMEREENADWDQVKRVLEESLRKCDGFRKDEGAALYSKLEESIQLIRSAFLRVKQEDPGRKEKTQQRIKNHFSQWMDENSFDANRFEQELIYYFEKIDVTEELVRLETHLDYFLKSMKEETSQGKKLGFISQEIGREINTIGSKANDAEIQKHVILMKDELEKIKEQSLNVL
ncbi:YicC/YloC family endoribonuclease [Algoriphagus sp. A40]|uniref:YicC/YloC family endoribonuclease n=1 Tax=Algoriphagus sp. A40 TaxID=1945863 RepID=UPI000985456B|nr:YicC/YloC family endoribonuclease [Algoriphagus sp. A40]OOG68628.1 YicC family protein [Algoriphagus sp. A40]